MDNFNRPDENPLSDGGRWANGISSGGESGLKVLSAQLGCGKTSTCTAWRNDQLYGLDQEASVTIATLPGTGDAVRIYARLQKPGAYDGYMLRFQQNSGTDQVFIERIDGGAIVGLATLSQEFATGNKLKIRAVGSKIEAWRYDGTSWAKVGEATDTTYTGVGYVGVGLRETSGRLDDFGAATLLEPTPDPSPVLDDFNRPDENPLSDTGRWGNSVYAGNENGLKVVSNQLAATSLTDTAWRSDQQYGADQEAWVAIAVKPGGDNAVRVYARLQAPGSSGYDGYMLRYQQNAGIDQAFIERIDNGAVTMLTTLNREFSINDKLRIRAIGSSIQAWRYGGRGWQVLGTATDTTYTGGGYIGVGLRNASGRLDDFGGGNAIPLAPVDPEVLLAQYAPELRYDVLDTFRADSAAMMTDNYQPEYSNALIVPSVGFLAQANPALPEDDLSLEYLGLFYPPGGIAQARASTVDDYIEAENNYDADAQRMHALPAYADKAYGRVVPESSGKTTLQYWFFYYFNWHPALTDAGDHEGDWEMIQIELDAFGIPIRAAYAQHGGGETCAWSAVSTTATGEPIVFVAQGSHASYFRAGLKGISQTAPFGDEVGGNAPPVSPSVLEIDPPAPAWLDWPGKWGGSGTSPRGPAQQSDKWRTPASWADDQSSCWEAFSARVDEQSALPARPPAPKIVATRTEKRVRIAYSFAVWPSNPERRPVTLITSVQPSERRFSPLVHRYRVTARSGTYTRPLGLGSPPFKLFAAAYSRQGRSSTTVMVRVRGS